MSLHLFADVHNTLYKPLQTHITINDSKRIKLGSGVCKKRVIDHSTTEITANVLVRKDRANQGAGVGEALDLLERMCPKSTRSQLGQALRRTVRPKSVAAHPTTTKRTAITVLQQLCRLPAAVCGVARRKAQLPPGRPKLQAGRQLCRRLLAPVVATPAVAVERHGPHRVAPGYCHRRAQRGLHGEVSVCALL